MSGIQDQGRQRKPEWWRKLGDANFVCKQGREGREGEEGMGWRYEREALRGVGRGMTKIY